MKEYLADLNGKLAYCSQGQDDDGHYRKFWFIGGKSADFTERFGLALPLKVRSYRCGTGSLWGIDVAGHQFLLPGNVPFDDFEEDCQPWD